MASTYSDLKIELIGTGEQTGTWGTTTNVNLGTALEEAIVGRANVNFTSDADLTLTLTNTNTTQVARNYILNVTSGVSLTTTRNLIVPTIDKPYIIENNTTGGQSIVVKTTAGTGVTVPNGKDVMVYVDSTNVVPAFNHVPALSLTTDLAVADGGTGASDAAGARTNLGVSATGADTTYAFRANNLSDLANAATARTNLGLGTIATQAVNNVAITGGTVNGTSVGATTPSTGSFTSLTDFGNLTFTGTGNRITGDFSNATVANRVAFQTSTTDVNTSVGIIPNGTAISSFITAYGSSDPTNTSFTQIGMFGTQSRITSGITGTGTYRDLTFYIGGAERMRIDTSGNVLVTNAAGIGYGTGAGGTVTQATSKTTAVTINKPCGKITMHNAALAAGASVLFNVNNSLFGTTDVVLVAPIANGNYRVEVASTNGGIFSIRVTNVTGGSLSEALQINFAIIKGAAA